MSARSKWHKPMIRINAAWLIAAVIEKIDAIDGISADETVVENYGTLYGAQAALGGVDKFDPVTC